MKILTPRNLADDYMSETGTGPFPFKNLLRTEGKLPAGGRLTKKQFGAFVLGACELQYHEIGQTLANKIRQYYDEGVLFSICVALLDLNPLLEEKNTKEASKITKARDDLFKRYNTWIEATNDILRIKTLLTPGETKTLTDLSKRLNNAITPRDSDLISSLPFVNSLPPKRNNMPTDIWESMMLYAVERNFKKPRTRPYKALNAVIIVIYKLLTEEPPKNMRCYKQWCKTLTAEIINKAYQKKLTVKDIDNGLHSV